MIVAQILNSKPDRHVTTVKPQDSVADLAALLSSLRIGAAVVSEDGQHILGIITERDIVRELGKRGPAVLGERVDLLMTRKIIACRADDTAHAVLEKMTEGRFRHMPVVHEDRMIGLISIGDVVKVRLQQLATEKDLLEEMIRGG